jgi:hypothetical protein
MIEYQVDRDIERKDMFAAAILSPTKFDNGGQD